jgi:hypothetical protein
MPPVILQYLYSLQIKGDSQKKSNKLLRFIKRRELLDHMSHYNLLKKSSDPLGLKPLHLNLWDYLGSPYNKKNLLDSVFAML